MPRLPHLEALRGLAAVYVLLHHAVPIEALPFWAGLPFRFGQEAVMLFFLLSGYLIHKTYRGDLRRYAFARIVRIYPIFIAALATGYVAASWSAGHWIDPQIGQLAGNLLMLQDRAREGTLVEPYMNNAPLWSLSYEAFFYLAFAVIIRSGRPHLWALALSGAAVVLLLVLPLQPIRFLAYLMVWWMGVALADGRRGPLVASAACVSVGVAVFLANGMMLEARHFGAALVLIAAVPLLRHTAGLIRPFALLGPISFALYAVHYPLITSGANVLWMVCLSFAVSGVLELVLQPRLTRYAKAAFASQLDAPLTHPAASVAAGSALRTSSPTG